MANENFFQRLGEVLAQSYSTGVQQKQQRQQQEQLSGLRQSQAKYYKAKAKEIEEGDKLENLMNVVVGFQQPSQEMVKQITPQLPKGVPHVGGGMVGPQGPVREEQAGDRTFMFGPQGQLTGERLTEKPLQPIPSAIPEILRKRLGITPEEVTATRKKKLGIKTPKGIEDFPEDYEENLRSATDRIMTGELTSKQALERLIEEYPDLEDHLRAMFRKSAEKRFKEAGELG